MKITGTSDNYDRVQIDTLDYDIVTVKLGNGDTYILSDLVENYLKIKMIFNCKKDFGSPGIFMDIMEDYLNIKKILS